MKSKRTLLYYLLLPGVAACFLAGEFLLFNPLSATGAVYFALPVLLHLLAACGVFLLYSGEGAVCETLLLIWTIFVSAIFVGVNVYVIATDGWPATLYCKAALPFSVPLTAAVAFAAFLTVLRKRRTQAEKGAASDAPPLRGRGVRVALRLLVSLLCLVYIAWVTGGLLYAHYEADDVAVSVPVEPFALRISSLDGFLHANYPDECADKPLTEAFLDVRVRDSAILGGTLTMQYCRLLDARRAGGNIDAASFCIDAADERLVTIARHRGARLAMPFLMQPIPAECMRFPLEEYVRHAQPLAGAQDGATLTLRCRITAAQLDMWILSEDGHTRLYAERVANWTPGTPFTEREYERTE